MRVELIDFTGCGQENPGRYAAELLVFIKNTRLEQNVDTRMKISMLSDEEIRNELDKVANTIRSSWEMVDYLFQITGVTRAFTHQLVRTRNASYAQQAQRVVDMSTFETLLPATVSDVDHGKIWGHTVNYIGQAYRYYKEAGVPSQDCRGLLPTNVLTNICMKVNLRAFADIVGKRENLRAQGEYADVVRAMKDCALMVHPWLGPFLNPERTSTPALDALLRNALGDKSPVDVPQVNEALKELDRLKGTWG